MKRICSECGTCVSMCPKNILNVDNVNKRDIDKCSNCKICNMVCPFEDFDDVKYDLNIFGKHRQTNYDKLFGIYSGIYTGYSTDENIRKGCSSGGIITTTLLYLLDNKYIDGAIVTDLDENLMPNSKICSSRDEIIRSKGSKYMMSHTNLIAKDILHRDSKRYAFVGLPCQIRAMRKLEKIFPILKEKIIIYIGMMCSNSFGNKTLNSQKLLLDALEVYIRDIKEIKYRGDGWPGKFKIVLKNGNELSIKYYDYIRVIQFFMPMSCFVCNDSLAEFADVSFGDAWLSRIKRIDNLGTSIIISRSDRGSKLIQELVSKNIIMVEKSSEEDIITSQKGNLYRKKSLTDCRIAMSQLLGYDKPNWNISLPNVIMRGYKDYLIYLKTQMISLFQYIYIVENENSNVITDNLLKIENGIFVKYLRYKMNKNEK